jgi:hypothetical protein
MSEKKGCLLSRPRGSGSFLVRSFVTVTSVCLQLGRRIPLPAVPPVWGCVERSGTVLGDTPKSPAPSTATSIPSGLPPGARRARGSRSTSLPPSRSNLVSVQDPIALGERATQHQLDANESGVWTTIATGTAIGERKLHRVGTVAASGLALVITQARATPAISELGSTSQLFRSACTSALALSLALAL